MFSVRAWKRICSWARARDILRDCSVSSSTWRACSLRLSTRKRARPALTPRKSPLRSRRQVWGAQVMRSTVAGWPSKAHCSSTTLAGGEPQRRGMEAIPPIMVRQLSWLSSGSGFQVRCSRQPDSLSSLTRTFSTEREKRLMSQGAARRRLLGLPMRRIKIVLRGPQLWKAIASKNRR